MGVNGVHSDSIPGSPTRSNYITTPAGAGWSKMDFADCNNAIVAGGANINSTRDGGKLGPIRLEEILLPVIGVSIALLSQVLISPTTLVVTVLFISRQIEE